MDLRPAALLFSQWPASCLACWFGRVAAPPQPPMEPHPLEDLLDGSRWDHPSRSGSQPDSVGILDQGCVTESGPICSAQARWDCCAGLIPARPEGLKGARGQRGAQTQATYRWSGPHCSPLCNLKQAFKSPQGLGVLRNCQHGQES